jgi:hypothetical protein
VSSRKDLRGPAPEAVGRALLTARTDPCEAPVPTYLIAAWQCVRQRADARKPGRQHQGGWRLAGPAQVFLQVELLLGLGKTLREIIEIAGADQLTPGGVAAWRHCPVLIGEAATPDQPPRVLASQLIEAGVLVGTAPAGAHAERRQAVNVMPCPQSQGIPGERRRGIVKTCGWRARHLPLLGRVPSPRGGAGGVGPLLDLVELLVRDGNRIRHAASFPGSARSTSTPLRKMAPARTSATRCGALTARQRSGPTRCPW